MRMRTKTDDLCTSTELPESDEILTETKSIFMVVGISYILLLAGGTYFTTMSLKTANAQAPTLGEPILVEKGETTSQSQLGPNRTQFTFSANGTLNGSIEVEFKYRIICYHFNRE
jgi:hypothetical protein